MLSKKLAALAALSLITASTVASAQSAQSLSLANSPVVERAGADMSDANELTGTEIVIGVVVLGLVIWGAIELFGDDDSDSP